MRIMSIGMVLLTIAAILVFFGVAQRVLDRMYLTDRAALILIALMFFGTLIPNLSFGGVEVSIGGALIPLGVCVYLLVRAGTNKERIRALVGSVITAAAVYLVSAFLLPDEPEQLPIDPMYLNGIIAGLIAYALGRSRRGAFICGILGVLLADIAVGVMNRLNGIQQTLVLGGAGVFDATMISGLLAVLLTELVGEIVERVTRGNRAPVHRPIHQPIRNKEK
ncbi:MAG: DUF1614 domain-containing protein [Clostridiales bacterium]|nr:DUF1614 domain-containing protein [Clostridiales bacterium]